MKSRVAVFDVVRTATRAHPFVLLQPRMGLQDLLPGSDLVSAAKQDRLPNLKSAYIGLVEETGSLFAMSPDRYPLVVFGDSNFEDDYRRRAPTIDPPPGSSHVDADRDFPPDVDSITRAMKRRKLKELCRNGSKDKRCLTGVRELESSHVSGLLDGAATVPYPPYMRDPREHAHEDSRPNQSGTLPGVGNASMTPPNTFPRLLPGSSGESFTYSAQALSTYAVGLVTLALMLFWVFQKMDRRPPQPTHPPSENTYSAAVEPQTVAVDVQEDVTPSTNGTATPTATDSTLVEPPSPDMETPEPVPQTPQPKKRAVSFGDPVKVAAATGVDEDENPDLNGDADESDADQAPTPGRRKPQRRKRGKKKKAGAANGSAEEGAAEDKDPLQTPQPEERPSTPKANGEPKVIHVVSPSSIVVPSPPTPAVVEPSLIVSETVLGMWRLCIDPLHANMHTGFGSHGTVVFKGSLQGRAVAVKRLLQDFVTLAAREVTVLQESDDHPNVIRYYYQEAQANFLYIALELCPATLADVIERPDQFRDIAVAFEPKRALRQITSGMRHLHALKIIHRDIKPQNILISHAKKGVGESAGHRMLISDFGLCKKLEVDQTSFLPTAVAGTVGWRAPEILRGDVRIDDSGGEESQSSRGSVGTVSDSSNPTMKTRLTKSVDIFALGCLFYYVLTNGGHPYGERYEREANIIKNVKSLEGLERFGEEGSEAEDLICKMLSPEPYERCTLIL